MKGKYIVLLTLAAGLVLLTSLPTARPSATKQRVEITAKGDANPASSLKFVLTPLGAGALKPDSGTETAVVANQGTVTRDGQTANIVTWISTCKGKRGSFVMRLRIEHVDAGNGFHIGYRHLETRSWDGCVRGDHRRGQGRKRLGRRIPERAPRRVPDPSVAGEDTCSRRSRAATPWPGPAFRNDARAPAFRNAFRRREAGSGRDR